MCSRLALPSNSLSPPARCRGQAALSTIVSHRTTDDMKPNRLTVRVAFLGLALVWGLVTPLYVEGLKSIAPFMLGALRNFVAVAVLLPFALYQRVRAPRAPRTWWFLVGIGLLWIALPYGLVLWGIRFTTSGVAAVLNGTNPFFVAIFAWGVLRTEDFSAGKLLGLLTGFAGVAVIFLDALDGAAAGSLAGNGAIFLSAVAIALSLVLVKKFGSRVNPLLLVIVIDFVGGVALLITSLLFDRSPLCIFSIEALAVVLYLGVFASAAAFVGYVWLLRHVDAVRLSMIGFLIPVVSFTVGALYLREQVSLSDVLGSLIVLWGIAVMNAGMAKRVRLRQSLGQGGSGE